MRIAARAPNHLGDGVTALPALRALVGLGEITIHAPRWGPELYRDLPARVVPAGVMSRHDVAVLFPPSFRAAAEALRCRRRIGTPTDHRARLLTDLVPNTPQTALRYASLVTSALRVPVEGPPTFAVRASDRAAPVPDGHVGLAPLSAAGAVRQWSGFADLARRALRPVVFYGGPGEHESIRAVAAGAQSAVGQPLGDLAATLLRCAVLVTNDSGLAHFGRAVGVPVVTVFGSTIPSWTGATGALAVEGPALPCRPCYSSSCRVGDLGCFEVSVERVWAAVERVLGG